MKPKIFISWSGEKSLECAKETKKWISMCLQMANPFLSDHDIESGSSWEIKITEELEKSNAGIVCLTKTNTKAPWILYEAGALAMGLSKDRVCTLLCGIKDTEVTGPLSRFNHTDITVKEKMLKLLVDINKHFNEDIRVGANTLSDIFERMWPEYESTIGEILSRKYQDEDTKAPTRSIADMTDEVLSKVRSIDKKISALHHRSENTSLHPLSSYNTISVPLPTRQPSVKIPGASSEFQQSQLDRYASQFMTQGPHSLFGDLIAEGVHHDNADAILAYLEDHKHSIVPIGSDKYIILD